MIHSLSPWLHVFSCVKRTAFLNHIYPCFRDHTSNPFANEIHRFTNRDKQLCRAHQGLQDRLCGLEFGMNFDLKNSCLTRKNLKSMKISLENAHIFLKFLHFSSRFLSITLRIAPHRVFWLLFLLSVSQLRNPFRIYLRFS